MCSGQNFAEEKRKAAGRRMREIANGWTRIDRLIRLKRGDGQLTAWPDGGLGATAGKVRIVEMMRVFSDLILLFRVVRAASRQTANSQDVLRSMEVRSKCDWVIGRCLVDSENLFFLCCLKRRPAGI